MGAPLYQRCGWQVIAERPPLAVQQSRSIWGWDRQGTPNPKPKQLTSIIDGLKQVYFSKVRSCPTPYTP